MLTTSSSYQNLRQRPKSPMPNFFDSKDSNEFFSTTEFSSNDPSSNSVGGIGSLNLPQWTADEQADRHFWYDTSASGEACHVGDFECLKFGPRKKCSACKIICHTACIPRLDVKCKPTFRQVASSIYRDRNRCQLTVKHHWVLRRQQENRCQACGKWIQNKFKFKDTVYMQCSWCRLCYHHKPDCFKSALLSGNCLLGQHAKLIIPPTWILKISNQEMDCTSVRRSPSNPAFTLSPSSLKPSASVEALGKTGTRKSADDLVVASSASTTRLSLPSTTPPATSPRPVSSATCEFPFVVKPSCRSAVCPLIVFINPKAGGNQGVRLIKKFQGLLNPRQVFVLSDYGPKLGLELFGRLPNARILVCGGDGTVGWILSEIDSLGLYPTPPVAVLPLGTGNDLARTLQWGPGYTEEPLSKILTSVEEGRVVLLDRWNITSRPLTPNSQDCDEETEAFSSGTQMEERLPLNVMNNYFSLGADAATALEFHESRKANPDRFNSRLKNKIFYAGVGGKDLIKRSWKDLSDYVTLICDGVNLTSRLTELRPHVLLFLNIPKYSAGTVPWGHSSDPESQQRIDDKKIEVIGLTTASLATLQMGGHGDRICQCSEVQLTTRKVIPMQVDGEPCRLGPSIITIKLRNQAFVVQKSRRIDGSSPAHFSAANTSGRLVKIYIIYPDQSGTPETLDHLCQSAQHFVSLRIGPYSDLSAVRRQIKHFSNSPNCSASTVLPKQWIFLDMTAINGFVFGIDPNLESAHFITDILSNDNELFLLRQDDQKVLDDEANSAPFQLAGLPLQSSDQLQLEQTSGVCLEAKDCLDGRSQSSCMNKSSSTECSSSFAANRKLSLPAQLDTSISFPTLQMTFFQVDTPSSAPPNFPSSEVVDEESEKVEKPTSPRQRRFHGWRRLRLPPKILISTSTATTTSRKQSRCLGVGVAPQLVQSLTSLHSGLPPPPPSPPLPHPPASTPLDLFQCLRTSKSSEVLSKRSASSDPEIAQDLPSLIKSNLCTYFLSACRAGRLQEVQQALDAGVAPTTVDPVSGKSGLHQAAKFGRLNVVQYLIESAPRELLDLQDFEKKQTALHKAAACHRRRVCESLIRAGASAVCQDVNGDTPRILALRASDKKLAHTLQIEELMQMIKRSNEEFQPSAKVTPSTPPLPHTP